MGQSANPRRVADNEAMAMAKYLTASPQKVNLVAQLIRGKKAETALIDLDFCKRRVARDVKKSCNRLWPMRRTTIIWILTGCMWRKPTSASP